LIELLVVLAIIGLLLALVIPAVRAAREAARRTQCSSNLKQIGIAVTRYASDYGTMPPGGIYNGLATRIPSNWNSFGWMFLILPNVEQAELYNAGNFQVAITRPENTTVVQAVVELYLCPSDGGKRVRDDMSGFDTDWPPNSPAAITNYLGNIGDNIIGPFFEGWSTGRSPPNDGKLGDLGTGRGVLWRWASSVRFQDIVDGTSHTFLAGEGLPEFCKWGIWSWGNGCTASTSPPLNYDARTRRDSWQHCIGFRSRHPGGAHFAFVDGHVKFVSDSIDRNTYLALSTRGAGDAITDGEF
jgi:prepilin-type processing-associated H-X9-DG protein